MITLFIIHIVCIAAATFIFHRIFKPFIKNKTFNIKALDITILSLSSFALLGCILDIAKNQNEIEEYDLATECYRSYHNVVMSINGLSLIWDIHTKHNLITSNLYIDNALQDMKKIFNDSICEKLRYTTDGKACRNLPEFNFTDTSDSLQAVAYNNTALLSLIKETRRDIDNYNLAVSRLKFSVQNNYFDEYSSVYIFIYDILFSFSIALSLVRILSINKYR